MSSRIRPFLWVAPVVAVALACGEASPPPPSGEGPGTPPARALLESLPEWEQSPDGPGLFEFVAALAREAAAGPYTPPPVVVSEAITGLTYGQLRGIRFREDAALWRDQGAFRVHFFHPGGGFVEPVAFHRVEDGRSRPIPFDAGRFDYDPVLDSVDLSLPPEAGYAGFRILHPLNRPEKWDEVGAFLGASYFRLLGPGHVYGLSTRGLAVNTHGPGAEEFPDFTAFWLETPEPGDRTLTFHALLDGPSVTGAYRFQLTPGSPDGRLDDPANPRLTSVAVQARVFAREDVEKPGFAPLTSMYLHGTFHPGGDDDFRPRVHDSQGLLAATGSGEWIWRPLTNRRAVTATSLRDSVPRGFGLVQRERDFDSYLDLETNYHRRPSQWVQVEGGDWGAGGVELVEIPTGSEFNDNIVAAWVPDDGMRAGESRTLRYRIVLFDDRLPDVALRGTVVRGEPLARVIRTRVGWDALPGQADPPPRSRRRFVVDFGGSALDTLPDSVRVDARVSASPGEVSDLRVERLPGGGYRATFALSPEPGMSADLRLFLVALHGPRDGPAGFSEGRTTAEVERILTETWSYLWDPADAR